MFSLITDLHSFLRPNSLKPFKPKHVFVTRNQWKNIGGLVGLGMNLEVSGADSVTVHGPKKLDELYSSSRYFGISAGIKIIHNPLDNPFRDSCFTVDKIAINPLSNEFKRRKSDRNIEVYNYHFKVNDRSGSLDLSRCIELKVPVGPLLRKLKSGEDITLPDGRLIRHSEVCAPNQPGSEILVIDCPSVQYLDSLISNERLSELIDQENSRLKAVFHLSDIDVILEQRYQDWVNLFPSSVQHLGLNEYCPNLAYLTTHQQIYCFNKFAPDLFKQPYFHTEAKPLGIESRIKPAELLEDVDAGFKHTYKAFEPIELGAEGLDKHLNEMVGLKEAVEHYQNNVKDISSELAYPEIVFLGTASAAPGKYRNSSGIFINLNENETAILDCGEGTLYSIMRQFGPDKYMEKLCNLKFIYSSHLHADHHIGLINILLERERSFSQLNRNPGPLNVFMADAVNDFLKLYHQNFEEIAHLYNFNPLPHKGALTFTTEEANLLGLENICITRVPHCFQSTGISITVKKSDGEKFQIVYSGDTMPCEPLVRIGKDCDLLIHEATFSDHYEDEANKKRHTTTNQAIQIRDRMNAKFLILTHFSGRFAKLPLKSDRFDDRTGVAFDFLTLNANNLKKSAFFKDILEIMYKEDIDQAITEIEKRNEKNELIKKYIKAQNKFSE